MNRWNWHRKSNREPMTALRVDHYVTREDLAELLCLSDHETGAKLTDRQILDAARDMLRAAGVLEPFETWGNNYSEEEAAARWKWAEGLVAGFYERTSK
jgi:hypothetical protein